MRRTVVAALALCLAGASSQVFADKTFVGKKFVAGTVNPYYDENVTLSGCFVTGPAGGTVTIRVYGGSLTIAGFSGPGADGTDGIPGDNCPPGVNSPGAGAAGAPGYSFVLETWPSQSLPPGADLSLNISCDGITATGGEGGDGGIGATECQQNCTFYDAQDGGTAGLGGNGGSVTLR